MTKNPFFAALIAKANLAGRAAAAAHTPTPMIVSEHANPLDNSSPVTRTYAPVMGGVCGFAGVRLRPATSSLARYLKKFHGWRASYHGGLESWIGDYGQSMERKSAYATAFASVLRDAGFTAYAWDRMD